jgi:hypothetical protein
MGWRKRKTEQKSIQSDEAVVITECGPDILTLTEKRFSIPSIESLQTTYTVGKLGAVAQENVWVGLGLGVLETPWEHLAEDA